MVFTFERASESIFTSAFDFFFFLVLYLYSDVLLRSRRQFFFSNVCECVVVCMCACFLYEEKI